MHSGPTRKRIALNHDGPAQISVPTSISADQLIEGLGPARVEMTPIRPAGSSECGP
jgi:hypothetical protein